MKRETKTNGRSTRPGRTRRRTIKTIDGVGDMEMTTDKMTVIGLKYEQRKAAQIEIK